MNPETTLLATELVNQRITNMVLRHPFFSTIVLNLDTKPAPCGTACTDGTRLLYDPAFIVGLGKDQISGLLAHEIMHVALMHPYRESKDMDHRLANVAMDYEINNYLDTYNKEWALTHNGEAPFPLPAGGLIDHKWDGMAFEQIYAALDKEKPSDKEQEQGQWGQVSRPGEAPSPDKDQGQGQGEGEPQPQGQGQAPEPAAGGGKDKERMDWESIVAKAEQIAKMQGALPGSFGSMLDKLRRPEIPWPEYLRRYFDSHSNEDYDARRSDRRFVQQDIYLPTLYSEQMGEIVIGIDTSGSIYYDQALFERFMGEVSDVMSRLRPTKTTLLQCDTRITSVDEYLPGDTVKMTMKGGGGTAFEPFFDHVRMNNITPRVMVIFTDGFGSYPHTPPDYDVLWVDYGNYRSYPFGDVIRTSPSNN